MALRGYFRRPMTYPEALRYLASFINYEKSTDYSYKESYKLSRVQGFLRELGNPQDHFASIHVAGTKGKGSTCALIAYILRQAGYKTGLYTSPHLSDFRERIRILDDYASSARSHLPADFEGMIAAEELTRLVGFLKPKIERYNKKSACKRLSFFEVYTALSFVYFKQEKVDFAVLETGLGGRLDATNVVHALVCVLTPISYEHTDKLGHTLKEIAQEKAGIIRYKDSLVVCAPQEEEARAVIRSRCQRLGAPLFEIQKDIFVETSADGFDVMGLFEEYPHLEIRLIGRHQRMNAALAVASAEALRYHGFFISAPDIREGLARAVWPGRCEVVASDPLIVLDGAQNRASAKVLAQAIRENFKYRKLVLVLGFSRDKDIQGVCAELSDLADEIILTRADNPRAADPRDFAKYFDNRTVRLTEGIAQARKTAVDLASSKDMILVTGSLFVVGEFRNAQG